MESSNELGRVIIGSDTGLKKTLDVVERVAATDLPVLLLGETGTGKEVVARAIHEKSRRRSAVFLRVNCGALSPSLIDSELFGHEKGSFTGASAAKKGWFERADGGTLFLDEIGEMPEAAQIRLLRVLQDGTFERVGGERAVKVNVRVIAATHRDLAERARDGRFRQDLWYRISSFPIEIPSLRDRPEDIPRMAAHFAQRAALRFGMPEPALTNDDISLLSAYSWPGNVRELIAVIERAVLLGDAGRLELAKAIGPVPEEPARLRIVPASPEPGHSPVSALDRVARKLIEEALLRSHGRIEGPFGAAKALGLHPNTLRSRMKRLGLNARRYKAAA